MYTFYFCNFLCIICLATARTSDGESNARSTPAERRRAMSECVCVCVYVCVCVSLELLEVSCMCTIFSRIEAQVSISFSHLFTPASKWDRPLLVQASWRAYFSYVKITMSASQLVAVHNAYEKKKTYFEGTTYMTSWTPTIREELPVE